MKNQCMTRDVQQFCWNRNNIGHWTHHDRLVKQSLLTIWHVSIIVDISIDISGILPVALTCGSLQHNFPRYWRSTRPFPCEITLLPRDYRDRLRGENGFSHYAIMQIPLKSNRGRARYWETVAQKRRGGQTGTGIELRGRDAGVGRRIVEGGKMRG